MVILRKSGYFVWAMVIVYLIFTGLKIINIAARASDENYYFYTALLINQGFLPYRDFFFQHLPTQIILYAGVMRFFGFKLIYFRIIQSLFTLGTAALIYLKFKNINKNVCGLLSVVLFLFSILVLHASDMALGVQEATFFLILAWYLFIRRPIFAGLFLFLGMTVRMYILPAALGFIGFELWKRNYSKVFLFLLSSLGPFFLVNLLLFLKFGEKFLTPVWRYHFLKSTISIKQQVFADFSKSDLLLVMFAVTAIIFILNKLVSSKISRREIVSRNRYLDVGLAAVSSLSLQFIFLAVLSLKFPMYLVTIVPFMAVLAALALSVFVPKRSRRAALLFVMVFAITNIFIYQRYFARASVIDNLDILVKEVRVLTSEEDKLYGQYTVAPLVAILAKRSIIENEVDTNYMRYYTDLLSAKEATRLATQSAVFIQTAKVDNITGHVYQINPVYVEQSVISEYCKLYSTYRILSDPEINRILLWSCAKRNIRV